MEKAKSVFLLSDVPNFVDYMKDITGEAEIDIHVESEWSPKYRISEDMVMLGSKYLEQINVSYYPIVTIILKDGESPFPFMEKGITRFIFDYENRMEMFYSFFHEKKQDVVNHVNSLDILLSTCPTQNYCIGDYTFFFDRKVFRYKGQDMYLTQCEIAYLAEWLLLGHKDYKRRSYIARMKVKFGSDFLSDIDSHGIYTGKR